MTRVEGQREQSDAYTGGASGSGPGVEFTETMRGFASTKVTDDYKKGREQGEADKSIFEFTVTVTAPNIDRLIADPEHEALLGGSVTFPALSSTPLRVVDGRFHLLVRDADRAGTRKMVYEMPLVADDGRHFYVDGFKTIHDDAGPDLWSDTTTLYVTVREGDDKGKVIAKGIVNILIKDFRKQLGTMKAIGAKGKLEELLTLAKFGRFFMGALNEIYGGIFAKPSAFNPDAPPRVRRELRCGTPEIHYFKTKDGVQLKLTRFEGGTKGPVILSPGFGTSALAYTIDTTETNYPEYLYERGYDVWVFDYRASPDLPSAATQFTLDDIALYDYPAAVNTVRSATGRDTVQIMAHCVGSQTMLMSLASGLEGVRSAVASQLTLHPRMVLVNKLRAGLYLADVIQGLGIDTLTTDISKDASWSEKLYDAALRLYPKGKEQCSSAFCRRVTFMYGEVYDHDQLNDATHEHLHEAFGVSNLKTFKQITQAIRKGHVVSADGEDVYLPNAQRLKMPIAFLHGEHNRLFLPEGSKLTYEFLSEKNGPEHYVRHVFKDYAHMDCFIGKDAARDVYPVVTAELDKHN
ncbi:MAG TPA: alpha/beta fold hydrolase [Gemmatimonadaceae bacterium]|nr:alpha/beta fold hydrolase [Gemmatimonadaceae bacterium]